MSFWRRTPEEKAAHAALRAEKERLYVARQQAATQATRAKVARAKYKLNRLEGKQRVTEAKTRRVATRLQRSEEREEARYISVVDRLERDRSKGKAKVVRVRGSRRTRRYRRSRPRR